MYWGSLTFYFTSVQTANQYKGPLAVCEEDIDQKKYLSCVSDYGLPRLP